MKQAPLKREYAKESFSKEKVVAKERVVKNRGG